MRAVRLFSITILALLVCALIAGCGENGNDGVDQGKVRVQEGGEMLAYFIRENPGKEVIKSALQDLNNDGREDLIVMYRISEEKNMMRVILDLGDRYVESNEVPAPYSDQMIQFRDIDNKPPMEFIVQGMKGAKAGFAVFRIEGGGQLVDLFGQGMDDCC